jgi:magnesium-protoporphyrin IX monomethyl ester (oxidative) cyclase
MEETIKEVVAGRPYGDILGLSYRENGAIIHNELRPLTDISAVDYPDRSLRRQDYYWKQNGVQLTNLTFDTVLTSRGCPYNCKFCSFSLNPLGQKRKYAERPLDSVIEELNSVSADVVMFSDDNFFTNPKRSKKLCDLIIENGIKKRFVVQTRIEIANDPELLQKAEKAGFKLFLIGIESPHDKILKQLAKGFTQRKVREAFKTLNQYSFFIHGYFIYANIGETEEEMVYIATFAKELKLDTISFQKLRIEKFSPLIEVVNNTPGYYFNRIGGPVFSDRYDRKALKQIRNRIRAGFYDFEQFRLIMKKVHASRLFSITELVQIFLRLPIILFRLLQKEIKKKAK